MSGRVIPLFRVFREVFVKRRSKRLQQIRYGPVLAVAKRQPQGEFLVFTPGQLPSQGNIPIAGLVKLPIHCEILKISPAVARSHVPARHAGEWNSRAHGQPFAAFLRHQNSLTVGDRGVCVVSCSSDLKMGRTESKDLEVG